MKGGDSLASTYTTPILVSIRAPREGGRFGRGRAFAIMRIVSIRAPREGGRFTEADNEGFVGSVSIRAPREGGRCSTTIRSTAPEKFQSAPPVKGGDAMVLLCTPAPRVSIRAPREGGRSSQWLSRCSLLEFQSAPPVKGGDPLSSSPCLHCRMFQSAPPVKGGDRISPIVHDPHKCFNPRPP